MSAQLEKNHSIKIAIRAARCGFFIAGFGLSVWAPIVPFVRQRIEMSDGFFGLLLLCVGVGSLTFMPLSSFFASRFGIRNVILACTTILLITLAGMALVESIIVLGITLYLWGGCLGLMDVVLNIQGLMVEDKAQRPIMSNLHGVFSLGTISGALAFTGLLMLDITPAMSLFMMMVVIAIICAIGFSGFLTERTKGNQNGFVIPTPFVALVGIVCFVVYLTEGAVLDWSALFLIGIKHMPNTQSGLGYASFSLMLMLGRFSGTRIIQYLGTSKTVLFGGIIATLGICISLIAPHWSISLLGYAIAGLGCANISPVLFSSLSRQQQMPADQAVTAAATLGYLGVLAGPAMLGAIAEFSSLYVAFSFLGGLLVIVAALGPRFK